MKIHKITLFTSDVPEKLRNIPDPPKQLFALGNNVNELFSRPCVSIIGSRKVTAYGKDVTLKLAGELAKAGVVIISGLALGVDSLAHKAALDAGGLTIAVLPTSVDTPYPATNRNLARQILEQGGALISERDDGFPNMKHLFIARNRIVAGLCDALLITEAAEKSGTLHTANFALEQGRPVLAVPGNITSPTSAGTNNLIKTGATPVTSVQDVFYALGIEPQTEKKQAPRSHDPNEQMLIDLLFSGTSDGAELLEQSGLDLRLFNQTLTMLEIRGHIRPLGNNKWGLS